MTVIWSVRIAISSPSPIQYTEAIPTHSIYINILYKYGAINVDIRINEHLLKTRNDIELQLPAQIIYQSIH